MPSPFLCRFVLLGFTRSFYELQHGLTTEGVDGNDLEAILAEAVSHLEHLWRESRGEAVAQEVA
jgi:hypothetical protein